MFGRKKGKNPEPDYPDSRFCLRASELPFFELYGRDRFVVAISQITRSQSWIAPGSEDELEDSLEASGVLHVSGTDQPLLPVRIKFEKVSLGDADRCFGPDPSRIGRAYLQGGPRNPPFTPSIFILNVGINDPDGRIADAFVNVMQQAAVSKADFVHPECVRGEQQPSLEWSPDRQEQYLREVEAGTRTLEPITFDRVGFEQRLDLNAPTWSWAWNDPELGDLTKPGFRSKATAEWRRYAQRHDNPLSSQGRSSDR